MACIPNAKFCWDPVAYLVSAKVRQIVRGCRKNATGTPALITYAWRTPDLRTAESILGTMSTHCQERGHEVLELTISRHRVEPAKELHVIMEAVPC